jgi:hypothetical protein
LVVSPFGVASLIVPQYDIEFRGFIESDVMNSVNPLNLLSCLRNSDPATLYRETTEDLEFRKAEGKGGFL